MNQYKRIFIVGLSGAGKGVLAQALAKELGWLHVDSDFGLAPSIGRDLNEILGKEGQESFERCLSEILAYQVKREKIVVTTDEQIVIREENRKLLASEFTVYLKVSPAVQLKRISHNRPLLPVTDYKEFLNNIRQERDSLYEQSAKFSISSDDGSISDHVLSIIKAIGK